MAASMVPNMVPNMALCIPSLFVVLVGHNHDSPGYEASNKAIHPTASLTDVVPETAKYVEIAMVAADAPMQCK